MKTGITIEDIKKLTDDQLRDRICECLKWVKKDEKGYWGSYRWYHNNKPVDHEAPWFTTDLNAMHEAENYFLNRGDEWNMYTDNLCDIIVHNGGYQAAEMLVHASARTRAQAFVLTLEQTKA